MSAGCHDHSIDATQYRNILWIVFALNAGMFAIEIVVRLQGRGVTGGVLMRSANLTKAVCYGILFVLAVYWGWLGHWLYTWDTFVWVAGFAAIEMNVNEWRHELIDEGAPDLAV